MLERLAGLNPTALALPAAGVAGMLCGKIIPEKGKLPAKLAALLLAVVGAAIAFL